MADTSGADGGMSFPSGVANSPASIAIGAAETVVDICLTTPTGADATATAYPPQPPQPPAPPRRAQHIVGAATPAESAHIAMEAAEAAKMAMMEQFDALVGKSPPFVQMYVGTVRSWAEFVAVASPDTVEEVQRRVEHNLMYFWANYLLILVVFLVMMLFNHMPSLVVTTVVIGIWALYARMGGLDPSWRPKIGTVELMASHRLMILTSASVGFLFCVAGDMVLMLVGLSALIAVGHAALHPDVAGRAGGYTGVSIQASDMA